MERLECKRIMNISWELPLPPHIVQVIFSKLPISSLPTCRLVCKTWNDLVLDYASSSKFVPNSFLLCTSDKVPNCSRSSRYCNPKIRCIDIDTMSSVGSFGFDGDWFYISIANSSNGLLFISKDTFDTSCTGILNPMTNEFIKLPGPELENICYFGSGFSLKTKRYKLARVDSDRRNFSSIMHIFTFGRSGTNQWNHVDGLPFAVYNHGAYFNGVIYWIGKEKEKENEFVIYGFDVETEKIELIAVLEVGLCSRKAFIQSFNGTIYAIIFIYIPCCKIQVWMMRSRHSWIREFVIDDIPNNWSYSFYHLIKAFEDGEILVLANNDFFRLDKTGRKIKIKTLNRNEGEVATGVCHIESLNFGSLPNILAGDDEPFFYFI